MATCPFATQHPISGGSGPHSGGPFKIVHHTTEGSSAAGAFAAFEKHKSDPHFTVDKDTIHQHVDTGEGARALRNAPGGVETNRDGAIQIEVVGFAGAAKDHATLRNVARLCRWIEAEHGVPRIWPNGPPKPPVSGGDPGGHNRDAGNWDNKGGHYGHCHVPENTHWDPAYTRVEADYLLAAAFDAAGKLTNATAPAVHALLHVTPSLAPAPPPQIMLDHADVGENSEPAKAGANP